MATLNGLQAYVKYVVSGLQNRKKQYVIALLSKTPNLTIKEIVKKAHEDGFAKYAGQDLSSIIVSAAKDLILVEGSTRKCTVTNCNATEYRVNPSNPTYLDVINNHIKAANEQLQNAQATLSALNAEKQELLQNNKANKLVSYRVR